MVSGEARLVNRFAAIRPLDVVPALSPSSALKYVVADRKRAAKKEPLGDWASPTIARFPDQESRDEFLRVVAARKDEAWEVGPIADDGRVASVRWRAGHFLSLNDLAYTEHGCIMVSVVRRSGVSAPGVHVVRRYRRAALL